MCKEKRAFVSFPKPNSKGWWWQEIKVFAEATCAEATAVFAPWASAASEEGKECVGRAAAVRQRRFLTLPGTDGA